MGLQGKSLSILTPMYGGMLVCNYFESFLKLLMMLGHYHIPFAHTFTYNESLITRARNRLVDEFLKKQETTHAVFIDADIGFEPQDILAMMELDRDIIGAPCSKKSLRWDRVQAVVKKNGQTYTGEQLSHLAGDFVFNFEKFEGTRQLQIGELQEMRNMGTGLLMIKREVFEKYRESYPERWYEGRGDASALPGPIHDFFRTGVNPETHDYDSEDYCFCQDCKAIGFKVWMAMWARTSHMGTYKFIADMPAVAAAGVGL